MLACVVARLAGALIARVGTHVGGPAPRNRMHPLTLIVGMGGSLASFIYAVSVPRVWTNCAVARGAQAEL